MKVFQAAIVKYVTLLDEDPFLVRYLCSFKENFSIWVKYYFHESIAYFSNLLWYSPRVIISSSPRVVLKTEVVYIPCLFWSNISIFCDIALFTYYAAMINSKLRKPRIHFINENI